MAVSADIPTTVTELRECRDALYAGIAALQSISSVSCWLLRCRVWEDLIELQRRYEIVLAKIKELTGEPKEIVG